MKQNQRILNHAGVRYAYYYITPFVRKVERNRRDRGLPYHKVKKAA